jgi:hypothetical protein
MKPKNSSKILRFGSFFPESGKSNLLIEEKQAHFFGEIYRFGRVKSPTNFRDKFRSTNSIRQNRG